MRLDSEFDAVGPEAAIFCVMTTKDDHSTVQGHARSLILLPIESKQKQASMPVTIVRTKSQLGWLNLTHLLILPLPVTATKTCYVLLGNNTNLCSTSHR